MVLKIGNEGLVWQYYVINCQKKEFDSRENKHVFIRSWGS